MKRISAECGPECSLRTIIAIYKCVVIVVVGWPSFFFFFVAVLINIKRIVNFCAARIRSKSYVK